MKDPNNLDAMISAAVLCNPEQCMEILAAAEARGQDIVRRTVGADAFEEGSEHFGDFWLISATRPYMRVLQAQVERGFQFGRLELAWCVRTLPAVACSDLHSKCYLLADAAALSQ